MINTWFKFEGKIPNYSKVIMFTRNHTENNADEDVGGKRHNQQSIMLDISGKQIYKKN